MNDDLNDIAKRQKAVAIEQQGDRQNIPKITASGLGDNAEKILRLAFDNGVKVRKDEELVDLLSKFEVGNLIPLEALNVVSEILSHVYRENIQLDEARHDDMMQEKK